MDSNKENKSDNCEKATTSNCNVRTSITWSYDQTLFLIRSMETHIQDLNHPLKRKSVFENVSNDLISAGYNIDSSAAQSKWKSLTRSYTKAKDTKTRTGQGPPRFLFFDTMDEVLGDQPMHSNNISLNSMTVEQPETNIEVEVEETNVSNITSPRGRKRERERFSKEDYIQLKHEEHKRREQRHLERLEIEKEKIQIEKTKIKLLQELLNKKE